MRCFRVRCSLRRVDSIGLWIEINGVGWICSIDLLYIIFVDLMDEV